PRDAWATRACSPAWSMPTSHGSSFPASRPPLRPHSRRGVRDGVLHGLGSGEPVRAVAARRPDAGVDVRPDRVDHHLAPAVAAMARGNIALPDIAVQLDDPA